jgi:hypothetical protein
VCNPCCYGCLMRARSVVIRPGRFCRCIAALDLNVVRYTVHHGASAFTAPDLRFFFVEYWVRHGASACVAPDLRFLWGTWYITVPLQNCVGLGRSNPVGDDQRITTEVDSPGMRCALLVNRTIEDRAVCVDVCAAPQLYMRIIGENVEKHSKK